MELQRTANAGVLLRLDDTIISLDGVCREVYPYLATPPAQRAFLTNARIGLYAFTHDHSDHFDPDFPFPGNVPVLGTAEVTAALPHAVVASTAVRVGKVSVTPVQTRHMGKSAPGGHVSFVVQGSQCVWFMGDASPIELEKLKNFPKPDVLIVPFPYVSSSGAVRKVNALAPKQVVVMHLPLKEQDPDGLWDAVFRCAPQLQMPWSAPQIGETVSVC